MPRLASIQRPAVRLAPALLPGLAMLLVGSFRATRPSLGWDENATLVVATRSPGQIVDLIRNIDGSIGPYYFFMHLWTGVFGTSELALRAPSILAMAIGVGLVGEVGRRLFTPAVGLVGGMLLAGVPQLSRYAQDARAYGIAFMLVALATLLLLSCLARPTWWRWAAYGVVVVALGAAHMIGLTVLAGHAFAVGYRWWRDRDRRLFRWVVVTATALAVLAPLIVLGLTQRGDQLDWIEPLTAREVDRVPGELFGVPAVAWLIIALAIAARWPDRGLLSALAVTAAVPPLVLVLATLVGDPLWVPRYALFAIAPICLLAAVTLHTSRLRTGVVFVALAVLALQPQLDLRGPATHHGPDMRAIAGIIADHQRPGDGVVYGGPSNWSLRAGVDYYLDGRPAPRDLLLHRPAAEVGRLGAQECPDVAACVGDTDRIWLVRLYQQRDPLAGAGRITPVLTAGYHQVRVWQVTRGTVALYQRTPPPTGF